MCCGIINNLKARALRPETAQASIRNERANGPRHRLRWLPMGIGTGVGKRDASSAGRQSGQQRILLGRPQDVHSSRRPRSGEPIEVDKLDFNLLACLREYISASACLMSPSAVAASAG